MGVGLAAASAAWDLIPYGVIVGFLLIPTGLSIIVDRRNGVSINRYGATPVARKESGGYFLALLVRILAGILLQRPAGLAWAMAVCGALVFALTVLCGRRIESAALRGSPQEACPVTVFVVPDQGAVVAGSGMTDAPSRRHDPGGGVTGPGASRDR